MRRGLSLAELIIVIIIFGMVAALSMPMMSHAQPSPPDDRLREQLQILRVAIERYQQDHHGAFPGDASCDPQVVLDQLCTFSNLAGETSTVQSSDFPLGPYLRAVPRNPFARLEQTNVLGLTDQDQTAWRYDCETGYVWANADGVDPEGTAYRDY